MSEMLIHPVELSPEVQASAYCGADLETPADSLIVAKVNAWGLEPYLDRMFRARIALAPKEIEDRQEFLIDAAQTEYDAEFLCRYLDGSGAEWTPEFLAFEREWRRDEFRHYLGFCRIYGRLFPRQGEASLQARIEGAVPNFEPLREFLRDEFNVLGAIVFDEACTAKSYAGEIPFYARFGDPVFAEWIRNIAHDEVNHMRNAMAVLKTRHAGRLGELPKLLDQFAAHDRSGSVYGNTFLFDHNGYTPEFIASVVIWLKRQIRA